MPRPVVGKFLAQHLVELNDIVVETPLGTGHIQTEQTRRGGLHQRASLVPILLQI